MVRAQIPADNSKQAPASMARIVGLNMSPPITTTKKVTFERYGKGKGKGKGKLAIAAKSPLKNPVGNGVMDPDWQLAS